MKKIGKSWDALSLPWISVADHWLRRCHGGAALAPAFAGFALLVDDEPNLLVRWEFVLDFGDEATILLYVFVDHGIGHGFAGVLDLAQNPTSCQELEC